MCRAQLTGRLTADGSGVATEQGGGGCMAGIKGSREEAFHPPLLVHDSALERMSGHLDAAKRTFCDTMAGRDVVARA